MHCLRGIVLWLACGAAVWAQAGGFYLKDGDTVVFYGDSITDQRLYTVFTEAFVVTRFPKLNVRFVHSGWGGDRVTGGGGGPIEARLQRDVIAYQPTVMTIMLGMNDAKYRAFDPDIFQTFASGYEGIVKAVRKALPGIRITAIEPSPYDDVTRPPEFEGGYNGVLARYGEFLRGLAKRESLQDADLNSSVTAALRKANDTDAALAKKIVPDRIHPGAAGHLLMAEALLQAWNAPRVVTAVEIDAAAGAVAHAENTAVTDLRTEGPVSWTQLDAALPMPIDWTDPVVKLAVDSSDFVEALDQETLRVRGLQAGEWELKIDGESAGSFAAERLEAGINLAVLATPMAKQAAEALTLTFAHNHIHFARWRMIQTPLEKYSLEETHAAMDSLDVLEGEVIAKQREAAQPKARRYQLSRL